jgi:hypothetical protein
MVAAAARMSLPEDSSDGGIDRLMVELSFQGRRITRRNETVVNEKKLAVSSSFGNF